MAICHITFHKKENEFKNTNNPSVYRRLLKNYLVKKYCICPYCPFHGGENSSRRIERNWKKYRKTQYH